MHTPLHWSKKRPRNVALSENWKVSTSMSLLFRPNKLSVSFSEKRLLRNCTPEQVLNVNPTVVKLPCMMQLRTCMLTQFKKNTFVLVLVIIMLSESLTCEELRISAPIAPQSQIVQSLIRNLLTPAAFVPVPTRMPSSDALRMVMFSTTSNLRGSSRFQMR